MSDSAAPMRRLFVVLFLMSACTAAPHRSSAGNYVDGVAITSRVTAARPTDEADMLNGVVELDGIVDSAAAKARAEQIATESRGVQDIDNNLLMR